MTGKVTSFGGGRVRRHGGYHAMALGLLALLILMTGCSKTIKFTTVQNESRPATDAKKVTVLPLEALAGGEYEVIAKVFARHKGGMLMGKGADDLQSTIVSQAAKLGADAVVGFKTSQQDDERMKSNNSRWGSGIAVKRAAGPSGTPPRCDFIVALCGEKAMGYEDWKRTKLAPPADADKKSGSPAVPDTTREAFRKDSLKNEENWTYVLSAVEYQLEKKGYYTITPPASQMNINADSLGRYDAATFDRLFGSSTGHVAQIDLMSASRYNAVLAAGASAQVKAMLFSKASGSAVWENSASKTLFPTLIFGYATLFESGATRQQKAVGKAVKKLFETLRPLN